MGIEVVGNHPGSLPFGNSASLSSGGGGYLVHLEAVVRTDSELGNLCDRRVLNIVGYYVHEYSTFIMFYPLVVVVSWY